LAVSIVLTMSSTIQRPAWEASVRRPNPLAPNLMTSVERLAEVCALLALGLIRLRLRQSREVSAPAGESSLHFLPVQSGHANPKRRRAA
jgi:hypothetical protein